MRQRLVVDIFSVLSETNLEPARWLVLLGGTVWILAGTALLSSLYVRTQTHEIRGLIGPAVFLNAGNMGLPCAHLAFGPEGLEAAIIIYVVVAIFTFSLGIRVAKGPGGWREAFRMPLLYAAAAGIAGR